MRPRAIVIVVFGGILVFGVHVLLSMEPPALHWGAVAFCLVAYLRALWSLGDG
jgi:hypothetical protein